MSARVHVEQEERPRSVLLTGATDGIGQALARLWTLRGERPWLHGRRSVRELEAKLYPEERYLRADFDVPEGPELIQRGLSGAGVEVLDRLVLNAGAGWVGEVREQSNESVNELVDVNLWTSLELCHRLLPLLERGAGRIVFISSVVSAIACPEYAVYAATKAASEGLARSLRTELRGRVEVQVLRPGATRSGLHAKSGLSRQRVNWTRFPPAEDTAWRIDRAMWGPPQWATLGAGNSVLRAFGHNLPRLADRAVARGSS